MPIAKSRFGAGKFSKSQALRKARQARWLARNRKAIESYNKHVEKFGVFSDGLREF